MTSLSVKSLHIYPVKSGYGIDLQQADVHARGLKGDRRFMLVDADGQFITQRQKPELTQLCVQVSETGVQLSWPEQTPFMVKFPKTKSRQSVTVWRSTVDAAIMDSDVNTALSNWLGKPVFLAFMDDVSVRMANEAWTPTPSPVSFADGYPILVTNTASLAALNAHIEAGGEQAVPMQRFRPNIVVESDEPWGEDGWDALQIGDVILDLVKPCTRCIMTTLDQKSGAKQGREPLRSLKALRTSPDPRNPGVIFGMNAVARTLGRVNVGDKVKRV